MFTNDHEIATAWSDLTMFYNKTIKLTLKLCSLPHHLVLYNPNQPVTHTVASSLGSVTLITLKNFSMILSSSQLRDDFRYQLITPSMLHNSVNIHFKISERPGQTQTTLQRNIWQHCYAQLVAHVWPCWIKFESNEIFLATFLDVERCCARLASFLKTSCNTFQQSCNMLL